MKDVDSDVWVDNPTEEEELFDSSGNLTEWLDVRNLFSYTWIKVARGSSDLNWFATPLFEPRLLAGPP